MVTTWKFWRCAVETHQNPSSHNAHIARVLLFIFSKFFKGDGQYSVNYTTLYNRSILSSEMKKCGTYWYWKWNKQLFNEGLFCNTWFWILKVNRKNGLMVLLIRHFRVVFLCSEDNELPRADGTVRHDSTATKYKKNKWGKNIYFKISFGSDHFPH